MRVLVTPRSMTSGRHPALDRLTAAGCELRMAPAGEVPDPRWLAENLPGCSGYLAGVEPIGERLLSLAVPGLKVISRNGAGVDGIDLAAAERYGIRVARAAGANARGVAELAWGMMLSLARGMVARDRAMKSGEWERGAPGFELQGRTLGVVGCGAVGRTVAGFGCGFGMEVRAFDPVADANFDPGDGFRFASLETVLAESDIVTLHCPPPESGILLAEAELSVLKPGAIVINTARGDLVDEAAVVAALDSGQLAGYGADVFQTEPPGASPLVTHPKVLASPHTGAFTGESVNRAISAAVDNLLRVLAP